MTPDLTLLLPRSSSSIRLSVEDTVAVIEGDSRHRYIPEGQTSDVACHTWRVCTASKVWVMPAALSSDTKQSLVEC